MANAISFNPRNRDVYYISGLVLPTAPSASEVRELLKAYMVKNSSSIIRFNIPVLKMFQTTKAKNADRDLRQILFNGVQSISIHYARDVVVQYGLEAFSFLPWYTKAVAVTISGRDYIGSFATEDSLGISIGNSVYSSSISETIRRELRAVDNLRRRPFVKDGSFNPSSLLSTIQIGEKGKAGFYRFAGFITEFSLDEKALSLGVIEYTLNYLGVDYQWIIENMARQYGVETTK